MRINVSEAYREEFEILISKYQKLCDRIIDLVVDEVSVDELNTYCIRNHPDVMWRLTDTVSSSDIMRGIVNKCSITYITPLREVMEHYGLTDRERMIKRYQRSFIREGILQSYQHSLDEYLSKLRVRYLLGSSKDIVNAETIMFILHWKPDEASFFSIRCLLYEAFHYLNKKIIVQATGKKILHLLNIYHNYTVTTVPLLHVSCYGYFNLIHCFQFYYVALCGTTNSKLFLITSGQ